MPQVPTSEIDKNVKFQAAYTSSTFNNKNHAFYRMSGVLEGLNIESGGPGKIKVTIGAFIQDGIIVELLSDFSFDEPGYGYPWTIYAYTDDEVLANPTTIDVAPSGSEPAGSIVLGTTSDGVTYVQPKKISIKELNADLRTLEEEKRLRRNILCNAGFELLNVAKGLSFLFPGPIVDCWQAENLSDKAPGSRVDISTDSAEVLRGGAAILLTSEKYLDPGGLQADGTTLDPRVRSNARIYQSIEGHEGLIGEEITFACSLRLPPGHTEQLHDIEIAVYGSSIGSPGFSDTAVDKFELIIPAHTLTQSYQKFVVSGTITNINDGKILVPIPAFPGITARISYIGSEPDTFPVGEIDKVLIDDCMLYMGNIEDPSFFPIPAAVDWARAEYLFEAQTLELNGLGMSTDLEYVLGGSKAFSGKKKGFPTISFDLVEVTEDGSPLATNDEANYDKTIVSTGRNEYHARVAKLIGGFRPSRVKALVRAQN